MFTLGQCKYTLAQCIFYIVMFQITSRFTLAQCKIYIEEADINPRLHYVYIVYTLGQCKFSFGQCKKLHYINV